MNTKKTRVALVGAGGIGMFHLKNWLEVADAIVVGVHDTSRAAMEKAVKDFDLRRTYNSLDELLADDDVDAVDLCTPNMVHLAGVTAALDAGKHVLCEKPLSPEPAEIEKMIAARDRANRLLMTAQHFRFDDRSTALQRLIHAQRIGEIYYCRAWWLRRRMVPAWGPTFINRSLSGGGPCVDIGVHMLDLAMHFMGFPRPLSVTGIAPRMLADRDGLFNSWGRYDPEKFEVEDFAAGLVRFESGAALTLETSWMANIPEDEIYGVQLFGAAGGAKWPSLELAYEHDRLLLNATVRNAGEGNGHRHELNAFIQAIREGGPSPVPAEQSLAVARVLTGLYRSHETGREVQL